MSVGVSRIALGILTLAVLTMYFHDALFADMPFFVFLQILAGALMLWARFVFGRRSFHGAANPTEGKLITSGPYRWIRHPIYSAILLFVWTGAVSHLSLPIVVLAIVASGAILTRLLAEERLLLNHYPEYKAYAARTKRIIPFIF